MFYGLFKLWCSITKPAVENSNSFAAVAAFGRLHVPGNAAKNYAAQL
jgi:hypothetical protein